jgi:sugar diacid utilization regulator
MTSTLACGARCRTRFRAVANFGAQASMPAFTASTPPLVFLAAQLLPSGSGSRLTHPRAAETSPVSLAHIATASARPPGLYRLEDLALGYQLSRPGPARAHVSRLLDPLDGRADLLLTLTAFLRRDLDRHTTARVLSVHPNTVLHRLRKITGPTGLDATRPTDLPMLHAAVTCRTVREPSDAWQSA